MHASRRTLKIQASPLMYIYSKERAVRFDSDLVC